MKRSPELRDLSDDHHRALVLAKRARVAAGKDSEAVSAMWQAIRSEYDAHLAVHFAVEEAHLLPPVNRVGGAALARRVAEDHAVLRAQAVDGPHDAATLSAFAERLAAHVRFEERELFPFAEEKLSKAELRGVADATAARSFSPP